MSAFPATPQSLLVKIAAQVTGDREATWSRFFELYRPVIVKFAEDLGVRDEAEDVAQDVMLKLVKAFQSGSYCREKGRFRSYLASTIRHEVINRWQKGRARAADRHVSLESGVHPRELAVPSETVAILDAKWRLARHAAIVDHVLTKTALSQKSRQIYRAYVLEEQPIGVVAEQFGIPKNAVSQVKTRVERMIADYEVLLEE